MRKAHLKALEDAFILIRDAYILEKDLVNGGKLHASDLSLLEYLPERFQYDAIFANKFMMTIYAVSSKIQQENEPNLSYVAEELAFHTLLETAKSRDEVKKKTVKKLEDFAEDIYEDTDFLMLFNPSMDGIENDKEIESQMGYANLQFSEWFMPFR